MDDELYALAEELGQSLASKGYAVACGGLSGIMEAVCKGAKEAGGTTIGILPSSDPDDANQYVDIAFPTDMGLGRNLMVVRTGKVVIAIDGREGTLSEMALTINIEKPLIILRGMKIDQLPLVRKDLIHYASTVDETMRIVERLMNR